MSSTPAPSDPSCHPEQTCNASCDACSKDLASFRCVNCNFSLCLADSTKHSIAVRSHTIVPLASIPPTITQTADTLPSSQPNTVAPRTSIIIKLMDKPSASSSSSTSTSSSSSSLSHEEDSAQAEHIEDEDIIHVKRIKRESLESEASLNTTHSANTDGDEEEEADERNSSNHDDSSDDVAPHEEETFINFVKKFELKKDEDGNIIQDEDAPHEAKPPERTGRGARIIKKRKLGYDDSSDDESSSLTYVSWEQNFAKLVKYKKEHGDCCVPTDWGDPSFARWIARIKQVRTKGKIGSDRLKRLSDLGFVWNAATSAAGLSALWDQRFEEVKQFKKVHGHCNVPYRWKDNKPLANWVFRQREHKKSAKLTQEREARLTQVGFVWGSTAAVSKFDRWDQRVRELHEYRLLNSHCCVPNVYPKNQQLANWVRKQRELKKKGKLAPERLAQLSELGFAWEMGDKSRITAPGAHGAASSLPLSPTTFALSTASPSTTNTAAFLPPSPPHSSSLLFYPPSPPQHLTQIQLPFPHFPLISTHPVSQTQPLLAIPYQLNNE